MSLDSPNIRVEWHLNQSNGLSRKCKCDTQTTDRQTTVYEKCVTIFGNQTPTNNIGWQKFLSKLAIVVCPANFNSIHKTTRTM